MARTKGAHCWSDEEIDTLRRLRRQGVTMQKISEELGKKPHCIFDWLRRYAHEYNIPTKEKPRVNMKKFNKEWYGAVPYLHWSITKPWRL